MIVGIGIDIEEHGRFKKYTDPQKNRVPFPPIYTDKELANYKQFGGHLCYAISFCCKEAFFKAFGISWTNSKLAWTDIELLFDKEPEQKESSVSLHGYAQELAEKGQILFPCSYSYQITPLHIIFETILECKTR